ncbi:MAG: T9SS type A sorting domain-containing protein [Chitinophagaceae bacterium]
MRRLITIISFILLITIQSQAQSIRNNPVAETADRIVKLYPNPATSYVTFDVPKGFEKTHTIQIYSFLGKKMYESVNLSQKLTVQLNEFTRGLYIYHLVDISNGKIVESGKFQVSR